MAILDGEAILSIESNTNFEAQSSRQPDVILLAITSNLSATCDPLPVPREQQPDYARGHLYAGN